MSPEEAARYDGYWNNVADDMLKSNLGDYRRAVLSGDITKTTGGKINSKVVTAAIDTNTGDIYYGISGMNNNPTRNMTNPQMQEILNSVNESMTNYPLENRRIFMIEVDKILEQAGYFETRKESVEEILKMYMANGYDSNSKQITFLEKYAFLEIRYTHPIWKQEMCLRMNPIEAQKIITMDVVEEYNEFLQDKLLIIGDIEKENMTIFLSEKGTIYSGYDDCIIDWGTDFKIFLKHLINGEKGKLIIID